MDDSLTASSSSTFHTIIISTTNRCAESIITAATGGVTASRLTFDRLGVPGGVSERKPGPRLESLVVSSSCR